MKLLVGFCVGLFASTTFQVQGFPQPLTPCESSSATRTTALWMDRRSVLAQTVAGVSLVVAGMPGIAHAGIDPSLLKALPVEGDASGAEQRLRQVQALQNPVSDLEDLPYQTLPSGVSYREYRGGKGDAVVTKGSKVAVEMTIRCKSFATANDPGGVKYYSTKDDTDFNELAWTVGDGTASPALEEGMMGMHKNALRRIEIPSTAAFSARNAQQLPLATTKDGKRRYDNLFKTDATLLFEVLVTRVK